MDFQTKCICCSTKLATLALLVAGTMGCGGPTTADVRGKVLYKDGSVPQGGFRVVRFEPAAGDAAVNQRTASGEIADDGSFEMFTRRPGDGVVPGEYVVTFSVWKSPMEPISLIADEYTKAETTPIKVSVDHDLDNLLFEVERKK